MDNTHGGTTLAEKKTRTRGISPKVYIPAGAQILAGAAFLILGLDVEGRTALATGVGTLLAGYTAQPGKVETESVVKPVA